MCFSSSSTCTGWFQESQLFVWEPVCWSETFLILIISLCVWWRVGCSLLCVKGVFVCLSVCVGLEVLFPPRFLGHDIIQSAAIWSGDGSLRAIFVLLSVGNDLTPWARVGVWLWSLPRCFHTQKMKFDPSQQSVVWFCSWGRHMAPSCFCWKY